MFTKNLIARDVFTLLYEISESLSGLVKNRSDLATVDERGWNKSRVQEAVQDLTVVIRLARAKVWRNRPFVF